MGIILSILIGILFAGCGIAYKIGAQGKVYPIQCAAFLSCFGVIVFSILGHAQWYTLSWPVVAAGALFGVSQYLGIRLLRLALTIGPLSPAWCASSLNFILVIVYAGIFLGESLSTWQYGAIFATVGAILAAACDANGGKKADTLHARLAYGGLLVAILVSISILNIGLKFCSAYALPGHSGTILEESDNALMALVYLFLGGSCALDLSLSHSWRWNRYAFIGGGMLSVCAILAFMVTLLIVAKTSAVVLFVLSNATSILGASLIASFFMKEKRTVAWYLTIGFSLLAILLAR